MKLLLDTCVWGKAQQALAEAGHDVEWAGDWEEDPGDEEILARADGTAAFSSLLTRISGSWRLFETFLIMASYDS